MKFHAFVAFYPIILLAGCGLTPIEQSKNETGEKIETLPWCLEQPVNSSYQQFAAQASPARLSPGDRVQVQVHEGGDFSGIFEIDNDGFLHIPYLPPLQAQGKLPSDIEHALGNALSQAEFIRPEFIQVSVKPLQWAAAEIYVSGAVFDPGRIHIGGSPAEIQNQMPVQRSGQYSPQRALVVALSNAGGVRPDADLSCVQVERNGKKYEFDLRNVMKGKNLPLWPLVAGDQVHVPSRDCRQPHLIKPSAVTIPGLRLFMSNLSIPANSNAQAAVGRESTRVPYGTRLTHGVVSANCVGGTQGTNARRYILHISKHLQDRTPIVSTIALNDLLRNAASLEKNPYLMPNDAVACYDSGVTNIRDIARTFSDLLTPFTLLKVLEDNNN